MLAHLALPGVLVDQEVGGTITKVALTVGLAFLDKVSRVAQASLGSMETLSMVAVEGGQARKAVILMKSSTERVWGGQAATFHTYLATSGASRAGLEVAGRVGTWLTPSVPSKVAGVAAGGGRSGHTLTMKGWMHTRVCPILGEVEAEVLTCCLVLKAAAGLF